MMSEALEFIITVGRVFTAAGAVALIVRLVYSVRRTVGGKVWGVLGVLAALSVACYGLFIIAVDEFTPSLAFIAWINVSTAVLYWGVVMHRFHARRNFEKQDELFFSQIKELAKPGTTTSKIEGVRGAHRDYVVTVDDLEKAHFHSMRFYK